MKTHTVIKQYELIRLQEYGVGIFEEFVTKSAWKKALKNGFITCNGMLATTATMIIGGEVICLLRQEVTPIKKQFSFSLHVIYEDEYLAVIRKPAGILVSGTTFKTIANALLQNITPSGLADATQPQPVHRLDYPTTGLLLIGKTKGSIRELNRMFAEKQINKTYIAITIGSMEKKGIISSPIDNKEADTAYKVNRTVPSERFSQLNLVQLTPHTGRRHQLRKHMASLGNPILGDRDYASEGLLLQGKGMYLHAQSLTFKHPFTHKLVEIRDGLPQRFLKIFPSMA